MSDVENKLSIKTKLLLNKVMLAKGIVQDIENSKDKRVKNLQKIFGTCDTIFKPFYKGESKDFIRELREEEYNCYARLVATIDSGNKINLQLSTIIAFLTKVLQSKKMDLLELKKMWEILS